MLSDLDLDVLLHVLVWLHAKDILSLRKTSRHFNSITRLRAVWHNALVNLLADNIPLARIPLEINAGDGGRGVPYEFSSFSAPELERLVLATCRTKEAWESRKPERTHATRMRARVERVFILRFLPIRSSTSRGPVEETQLEGRYLLSFGHTAHPTLCMRIWDVEAEGQGLNGERLLHEWGSMNGRLIGLAVDEGNGIREWALSNPTTASAMGTLIAVSARCFDVPGDVVFAFWILCFSPSPLAGGGLSILKGFRLRGPLNARAMCGRLVAVQVRANAEGQAFGHGILKVVDWVRSTEIFVQDSLGRFSTGISDSGREFAVTLKPSIHGTNRAVLHVHFVHDWVIVFRESVVELYFVPPWSLGAPRLLQPSAVHKWNWQINTITVTERISWMHDRAAARCRSCDGTGLVPSGEAGTGIGVGTSGKEAGTEKERERIVCRCRYRPLSIVVRFESYYPWPVNLLHHFVLHVAPPATPAYPYPLNFSPGIPPPFEECVPPYALPPTLAHTVPSTVRLFGHSILALSPFGTLLWTDNDANDYAEGSGSGTEGGDAYFVEGTGERVAGRRLSLPPPPLGEEQLQQSASTDFPTTLGSSSAEANSSIADSSQARAGGVQVEMMPVSVSSATGGDDTKQTSVFERRVSESWYSLALCERKGRVAVGNGEGAVNLWDYF